MRNLHRLLQRSWHAVSPHRSLCISAYLASVEKYYPDTWLHPLTKCVGPRDGRQLSRWDMPSIVPSVCVSWMKHRVYIASGNDIQVWCIKSQQQLFVMEGHTDEVNSVAISSDGKRIVSGSSDNTVRRWDTDTGLPVGDTNAASAHQLFAMAGPIGITLLGVGLVHQHHLLGCAPQTSTETTRVHHVPLCLLPSP